MFSFISVSRVTFYAKAIKHQKKNIFIYDTLNLSRRLSAYAILTCIYQKQIWFISKFLYYPALVAAKTCHFIKCETLLRFTNNIY